MLVGREFFREEQYAVRPDVLDPGVLRESVGLNEVTIRQYIRDQEKHQRDWDQGELKFD